MVELVKAGLLVPLYIFFFLSFGSLILRMFKKIEFSISKAVLIGFFAYFGCFQLFVLPLILLLQPFHILVVIWGIFAPVISIVSVCLNGKLWLQYLSKWHQCHTIRNPWIYIFILFVIFQCVFILIQNQLTMDAAYYIGTVNTTLHTDTMYQINPYTGVSEFKLELRYALASLGMHSAVACKIFHIHPLIEMKISVGLMDAILSNMVVYLLAKKIFYDKETLWYLAPILNIILMFWFNSTIYAQPAFLLYRSYEGKAFCGNVIIPMVIMVCLYLWDDIDSLTNWKILFLVTFACNTISMSSMLIVAVLIFAMLLPVVLIEKKYKRLIALSICELPCIMIGLVTFLSQKGLIQILV